MRNKYNIAVVEEEYPRISQTFVYRQVQYLKGIVLTHKYNTSLGEFYELNGNNIFELENREFILNGIIKTIKWKLFKNPSYHWGKTAKSKLYNYLIEHKIDAVLAQFGPVGINAMASCKKAMVPLVVHFHGIDASVLLDNKKYRQDLRRLFVAASKIVVVNNAMKQKFKQLGCEEKKLNLIPVGASVEDFHPNYSKPSEKIIFLYVGRFVEKKSPLSVVTAFEKCLKKVPNARLIMIGDGLLYQKTEDLIHQKNLGQFVVLLGNQPKEVVAEQMKLAHIFVQHSITASNGDQEGWPVSIAEAAASGLPIVATKHTGITEQVLHNETGFLVDEGEVDKMSSFMVQLALSPEMRLKMGKKGRKHIEKNGSFRIQVKKLEKILYEAIES